MYEELHQECLLACAVACIHVAMCLESRATERIGGAKGKYKSRAHNIDCGRGLGGTPPGSFTCSEVCSGGF